jgi:hypothetical protein
MWTVNDPWENEFDPSPTAWNTLRWAHALGASTLGEAFDMLDQLEVSNDIPEVLGEDGTVDHVREELLFGMEVVGPDAELASLLYG